jgi:hypothetical protein
LALLVALSAALFATLVLKHLSYPLLWNDESETAMYAERILDFGYPKVHDGRNVVFELQAPLEVGLKEELDAYIGSTWGQYYFAVPGALAARRVTDPYDKTLLLRAPFALAGLAGMAVFSTLGAALFPESRTRRLGLTLGFFLLASLSTVLVLHLREMRHYPLVVLLVACCLGSYARFHLLGRGRFAPHCAVLATLLTLLFHVFTLPYAAVATALGLHQLALFVRRRDWRRPGLLRLARGLLPLVISAIAIVPAVAFFETFHVAGALARRAAWTRRHFAGVGHLEVILGYLCTRELLLPAAGAKLGALVAARAGRAPPLGSALERRVQVSNLLWLLVAVYVAVSSQLPFSYERYVVVLSPLLVLAFLLDSATLLDLLRRYVGPTRHRRVTAGAALAAVALALLLVPPRWPALRGRWREITVPYRGPIDFVVAHLRERYPRTDDLVIATNYESLPLLYYLGGRLTVGYAGANLREDMEIQPDVIVPRPWPRRARQLESLAARAAYEVQRLPVANLPFNNIPQLGPNPIVLELHHFETQRPRSEEEALVVLHRRSAPPPR